MDMKISIIGAGYVGLCTGAGLACLGHKVTCVDFDIQKVEKINAGTAPIFEEGLDELLKEIVPDKLTATTDYAAILDTDVTFICVGTPTARDGGVDLKYAVVASEQVGEQLQKKDGYHLVVVKSTVPPTTTETKVIPLLETASGKMAGVDFGVCMNPEFLKEGTALSDFLNPDMVAIGAYDDRSADVLQEVYKNLDAPILVMRLSAAEMVKYALNAALATKISFINEIGNICKEFGINSYEIADAISRDHRISPHFLKAGAGWGGSCFPKDVAGLIFIAQDRGYNPCLLKAAVAVNRGQAERLILLAKSCLTKPNGNRIAVLGAAFKAGTDDIRCSPAVPVISELLHYGEVEVYDPKAGQNIRNLFRDNPGNLKLAKTPEDALRGADLAVVVTDWPEFANLDYSKMRHKAVVDGRNIVRNRKGIDYHGLCW
jgi:UDPglucose 6-dehydrogenase